MAGHERYVVLRNNGALYHVGYRAAMYPMWYMAEGVGFEPTSRETGSGFQDRRLKPLGHPSASTLLINYT